MQIFVRIKPAAIVPLLDVPARKMSAERPDKVNCLAELGKNEISVVTKGERGHARLIESIAMH